MITFHGGVPGLHPGDLITPQPADHGTHLLDGCPVCAARAAGDPLPGDPNDATQIYVTGDRDYAKIFANGYPRGALYRVQTLGETTPTLDDPEGTSWSCSGARVISVLDPLVRLTPADLRRIMRRFGALPRPVA